MDDKELYDEIREKIVLAAEMQLMLFLNDEQLDGCVSSIFNNVKEMKLARPNADILFHIEVDGNDRLFVIAHYTKSGISVFTESKRIINEVMSVYDYVVAKRMRQDSSKEIKTKTYLEDGKIVIEFL